MFSCSSSASLRHNRVSPDRGPAWGGLGSVMPLNGTVTVTNAQPSVEPAVVYSYGGTKLSSSLNEITAMMVQQTKKLIRSYGKPSGSTKQKTIELKVISAVSEYVAFYTKGQLSFTARLGNGEVVDGTSDNKGATPQQDLDGCIVEGVRILLDDPRVRGYLAE